MLMMLSLSIRIAPINWDRRHKNDFLRFLKLKLVQQLESNLFGVGRFFGWKKCGRKLCFSLFVFYVNFACLPFVLLIDALLCCGPP